MKLHEYLEQVTDQDSFLEFARALMADKADEDRKEREHPSNPYSHGWNGWENNTIVGFLDSAIAWAVASRFGEKEGSVENPWKKFALFLYGGKIYE